MGMQAIKSDLHECNAMQEPAFKIIDMSTGTVLSPCAENNYLMTEWLSIARSQDWESYEAIISEMRGFNTSEFCKSIWRNVDRLKNLVAQDRECQIIPISSTEVAKENQITEAVM